MLGLALVLLPDFRLPPQAVAAQQVLERTIGRRASDFAFELLQPQGKTDRYEVSAFNGKVLVKGTTGVAMCRGAYDYLKDKCNSFVSWEGSNIKLPAIFPDQAPKKGSCPVEYRHYYNICTFGYTTAFWDWKRWQREIDWMALHGINMPLAMTGQDKVWQTVFKGYGVPQASLDKFFSGPAFQPWHWMGNLNGHMGPVPQSWLDGQAELQKKILANERALGMKPVVPGFSGFVPTDFAKFQPKVKLQSPTAWAGFEPTTFVDIRDPMFVDIGRRFVQEYRKEFGSDHLYLCDTFNEQNPQFPASTKMEDLANAGRSVYEGLRQADPEAVWVMQGWLFYNERDYWGKPEVEALLSKVPDGRMIILDLAAEQYEVWRQQPAMAKKGFIYCTLHNFGQNTGLGGNLQDYVDKQRKAAAEAKNMYGFGLTPEGIDQNPVVYELVCDAMWQPVDRIEPWLRSYARARYGEQNSNMDQAWMLLHKALYSKNSAWYHETWRQRPNPGRRGRPLPQMHMLEQAIRLMLQAAPRLAKNPLYQRDLVDVTKTWLGGIADREALLSATNEDAKVRSAAQASFFQTLDSIDAIMATRPEHRLSTWLEMAKSWGKTPEEKRLLEANARMQVTAWDGKGVLTDYANKEWAGLTKDFIAQRWKMYFSQPKPDYLAFEVAWADSQRPIAESKPSDPARTVAAAFKRYDGEVDRLESLLGLAEPVGNIAHEGEAFDNGGTEGTAGAIAAIDGDLDTYWAASPSPRIWSIGWDRPRTIKRIQVIPYFGDSRYYQYTVEVSVDGQSWTKVVDESGNTELVSIRGKTHVLASAVQARMMRINMLKNSANIGVHLAEVRVFEK